MNISIQARIQCPFFITEKNNILCCEGFVDGTCMTTKFPEIKMKTEHIKNHCFRIDGGKCPLASNLYSKYKLKEEKEEKEREERAKRNLRKTG